VKAFTRGLCAAVVSVGMVGVAGCGTDNEAEGQKLGQAAGNPGPENPKAAKPDGQPVTSQVDAYERSQKAMKNSAYPGQKKQ
jgi:hypothetical protein